MNDIIMNDIIMNDIIMNLFYAFMGSVFTIFIQFIPKIYKYIKSFRNNSLCDMKYSYLWVTVGSSVLSHKYILSIKKAFFSDYSVRATFSDNFKRVYKGRGNKKDGFISIDFKSEGLEVPDFSHHKYYLGNLEQDDLCFGLWLSTDMSNRNSCGGSILSRREISDADLSLYQEHYTKHKDKPVMYVDSTK